MNFRNFIPIAIVAGMPNIVWAEPVTVGAPSSGIELGLGWDSLRGSTLPGQCVTFSAVQERGQFTNMHMTEVSDSSEVMDQLDVSASASVKSIWGSGSAKASFAKKVRVGGTSTAIMVKATVVNGVLFAAPAPTTASASKTAAKDNGAENRIQLQPWAADLLKKDSQMFRKICGDSFISAIHGGAELIAMYTFEATSQEESEQFKASLEAKFTAGQFESDASKQAESTMSSKDIDVEFTQIGGAAGIIPTDPDSFKQKLQSVAKEAADAPRYHSIEVTPYADLGVDISTDSGDKWLDYISDVYWLFSTMDQELDDVRHHADQYDYHTADVDLAAFQDEIRCVRQLLYTALRANSIGNSFDESSFVCLPTPHKTYKTMSDEDLETLAKRLQDIYGPVPNAVRLRLPLPIRAVAGAQSAADFQNAALDWFIRRPSERMCALDPTDNECLTNKEIKNLKPPIRTTLAGDFFTGNYIVNMETGECWDFNSAKIPFDIYLAPCDKSSKTQRQFRYAQISGQANFLLPTPIGNPQALCMAINRATETQQGKTYTFSKVTASYAPLCTGRFAWSLATDGTMQWGRQKSIYCAEAVPRVDVAGQLQLKACDTDNVYQRWATLTPQEMSDRVTH